MGNCYFDGSYMHLWDILVKKLAVWSVIVISFGSLEMVLKASCGALSIIIWMHTMISNVFTSVLIPCATQVDDNMFR